MKLDVRVIASLALVIAFSSYIIVTIVTSSSAASVTLTKVFVAFRHGSRAPTYSYKTDPYKKTDEKYWPNGPGELTTAGKNEAYELGQVLRSRYNRFVGDFYKAKDFRMFSHLKERSLMSAALFLAGFFPPLGYQEWNTDINWHPVPVYPDTIFNSSNGINCRRFQDEANLGIAKYSASDLGLDENEMELIVKNTGVKHPVLAIVPILWDPIYFQDRANLPIPDWIRPLFLHKMRPIVMKIFPDYLLGNNVKRLLNLGPLAKGILDFYSESLRKMELHSWFELDIFNLLLMLGVEEDIFPEPSSTMVFEFHNNSGNEYFEVYYYANSKTRHPKQLNMYCGTSCPISALRNITEIYSTKDYYTLCNSGNPSVINEIKNQLDHFNM